MVEFEHAEIRRLLEDLDADEADARCPAMEQVAVRAGTLATEKAQLEAQADAIARIVAAQEGLLADATAYLHQLRAQIRERFRARGA